MLCIAVSCVFMSWHPAEFTERSVWYMTSFFEPYVHFLIIKKKKNAVP